MLSLSSIGTIPTMGDKEFLGAMMLRRWPTPMLSIPGNHDMGDGSGEVPLARRGRYVLGSASHRLLHGPAYGRLRETLRIVVSGHTHQHLDRSEANIRHVWMPSTAFVLPDTMQARVGEKVVGLGLLDITGGSARIDVLVPDGMTRHQLTELPVFDELAHDATHASAPAPQGSTIT